METMTVISFMEREKELRQYLKKLPYHKRTRTSQYQDLKAIVDGRHTMPGLCKKCGHLPCHAYAGMGERVTSRCGHPSCNCIGCKCDRCDLNWGWND